MIIVGAVPFHFGDDFGHGVREDPKFLLEQTHGQPAGKTQERDVPGTRSQVLGKGFPEKSHAHSQDFEEGPDQGPSCSPQQEHR